MYHMLYVGTAKRAGVWWGGRTEVEVSLETRRRGVKEAQRGGGGEWRGVEERDERDERGKTSPKELWEW